MKTSRGFTVIELLIVVVFAAVSTSILLYQKSNIQASQRDEERKTAINAMYYNLEEVYYRKNQSYPSTVNSTILTAMDPELFIDPNGVKFGEAGSNYRYEAIDCQGEQCKSYKLVAGLEKEADYTKTARNK